MLPACFLCVSEGQGVILLALFTPEASVWHIVSIQTFDKKLLICKSTKWGKSWLLTIKTTWKNHQKEWLLVHHLDMKYLSNAYKKLLHKCWVNKWEKIRKHFLKNQNARVNSCENHENNVYLEHFVKTNLITQVS